MIESNDLGQLAHAAPGHDGQHVDVAAVVVVIFGLLPAFNGFADQVIEEVCVLFLCGDVAGVEQNPQTQRLQMTHSGAPIRVIEFNLNYGH